MKVRTLRDGDFRGKRVLVRVDVNVPIEDGKVADATRIEASLPTIEARRAAAGQGPKGCRTIEEWLAAGGMIYREARAGDG